MLVRGGARATDGARRDANGVFSYLRNARPSGGPPAGGFRLSLDDLGEYVVPLRTEFTFGHARAGRADLGVIADLDPIHVCFRLHMSFHGGHKWRVSPVQDATLMLGGEEVDSDGVALEPGGLLQLSPHVLIEVEGLGEGSSSIPPRLMHKHGTCNFEFGRRI